MLLFSDPASRLYIIDHYCGVLRVQHWLGKRSGRLVIAAGTNLKETLDSEQEKKKQDWWEGLLAYCRGRKEASVVASEMERFQVPLINVDPAD
jgi:hypothetical protein